MKKIPARTVLIALLVLCNQNVFALSLSTSWSDPNFVICEGLGIHASGRVEVNATGTRNENRMKITNLSVVTKHPTPHNPSGTITYTDPQGNDKSIHLQEPWFTTIAEPGNGSLVLPRVMTSESGPSPSEQRHIEVKRKTAIKITVQVQFSQVGGGCIGTSEGVLEVP